MDTVRRTIADFGKGLRLCIAGVATLAVLWGVAYRFILGFTPLWLDLATIGATGVSVIVLWALGSGTKKFDYSNGVSNAPDR